jgi:signal transduction histidine kinase
MRFASVSRPNELKEIPVLFLSAAVETTDKVRAFQAGGVDYITKPFQLEEVTARVQTQLELRRQQRVLQNNNARLNELDRLRDDLVQMIVHDLRSPIHTLQMSLDLLQKNHVGENIQAAHLIKRAKECVTVLSQMTAQMLDVSRLESGQMPLTKAEADLTETAGLAIDSVAAFGAERHLTLDAAQRVLALCDADIVRRIIENLLINAIKFTPRHSEVGIRITRDGNMGRIAVSDQGQGIPKHSQEKIFEKFAQVDSENKRLGAGLGLAFCKLGVEAHGGRIGVTSAVGRGSTFWFTLPMCS